MRIQNLAIIFVIIILPISLIVSAFTKNQIETLRLQTSYDSKLDNATYDAIKAFQLNTINSSTSDLANSKLRDIEAAANTFFNSIATNFNMAGYNKDVLKEYVPALVFTMYDGYYIYSPYTNTLPSDIDSSLDNNSNAEYHGGDKISGIKPYVYYSCRYKSGAIDVVITYALDNYITVQGIGSDGKEINTSGYLLDNIVKSGNSISYRGVDIPEEQPTEENVGGITYPYIKVNGNKYYYDSTADNGNGDWFTLLNGEKYYKQGNFDLKYANNSNDMAKRYYEDAYNFKSELTDRGITTLTPANAVKEDGKPIGQLTDMDGKVIYDFSSNTDPIFDYSSGSSSSSIENPDSNFNEHRLAIIRYSIEKNLSIAVANYNKYDEGKTFDFQMPKLSEEEWAQILNNISLISFLQGLSIGGKIYNGHSIITNNKNEEVVTEDSIYITTSDGKYHRATERSLTTAGNLENAFFNIDFERKNILESQPDGTTKVKYYYPKGNESSYTSIVTQTDVEVTNNIYKYMEEKGKANGLAQIYYTAIARERYGMYKIARNPTEWKAQFYASSP